jgi:hypothetical protein
MPSRGSGATGTEAGVGRSDQSGLFFVKAEITDCIKVPNGAAIATGLQPVADEPDRSWDPATGKTGLTEPPEKR